MVYMCMCINELASWAGCACWLGLAGWAGWAGLHAGLLQHGEDSKEYSCMHFQAYIQQCDVHVMQSIHPEAANIHNSQLRE